MPKVSVIIPAYNHARYLPRRLDSVLGQTFGDFEVLFLDDASPDDSRAVFEAHPASKDPRVRSIFNEKNSGSTFKQWNLGLRQTTGEYVWFAESDDAAEPTLLAELVARLDAHPNVGLAYCQSWWVDRDGAIVMPGTRHTDHIDPEHWLEDFVADGREECSRYLYQSNVIPNASAILLRRSVLDRVGQAPEDMKVCGDWALWARVLLASDVAFVARPLNHFRTHPVTARSRSEKTGLNLEEQYRVQSLIAREAGFSRDRRAQMATTMAWVYLSVARGERLPGPDGVVRAEGRAEIPWRRHLRLVRTMAGLDRAAVPIVARAFAQAARRKLFPRRGGRDAGTPAPRIDPVPGGVDRPFWSVMVPTYDATDLLEQALRSVLDQDPGPDVMQIAVVDDRSPNGRAREIVERLAPGRVEFHEQPTNVGLAGNWNACIGRARGHWVHILHQDDLVLPGFYERMARPGRERPDVGAAFCRYAYVDGKGERIELAEAEAEAPGVLDDWPGRIALEQRIECPSIVVRRAVYEDLGGFRADLRYVLDWEMWVRIAFAYPFWYEPEPLACWRRHDSSESRRLEGLNLQLPDYDRALTIFQGLAPEADRGRLVRQAARRMRWQYHREVERLMELGRAGPALGLVRSAYRYEGRATRAMALLKASRWAVKVWLRGPSPAAAPGAATTASPVTGPGHRHA